MRAPLLFTEKGLELVVHLTCPARRISSAFNFLVDTGSEKSYLAWQDAEKVGIKLDELPPYPKAILGFGGTAQAKHLNELCFLSVQSEEGNLSTAELSEGLLIYRPSLRRGSRSAPAPALSIAGRDLLEKSGWRLVVDMARKLAYLELS